MCSEITLPAQRLRLVQSTLKRLAKLKRTPCLGFKGLREGWQSCQCVREVLHFPSFSNNLKNRMDLLNWSGKTHKGTF